MNEIARHLFLLKMAAVWHFAHAAACLVAIILIMAVAMYIHVVETNALGPGSRRIVDMAVEDAISREGLPEALDKRRVFGVYLKETIKRRFAWTRKTG